MLINALKKMLMLLILLTSIAGSSMDNGSVMNTNSTLIARIEHREGTDTIDVFDIKENKKIYTLTLTPLDGQTTIKFLTEETLEIHWVHFSHGKLYTLLNINTGEKRTFTPSSILN